MNSSVKSTINNEFVQQSDFWPGTSQVVPKKILIPQRNYVPSTEKNSEKIQDSFKSVRKDEEEESEVDPWGEIDEKPKYIPIKDPWDIHEFVPTGSLVKNVGQHCEEKKIESENKIKIPTNPYQAKNPEDKPMLPPDTGSRGRPRGRRNRGNRFRNQNIHEEEKISAGTLSEPKFEEAMTSVETVKPEEIYKPKEPEKTEEWPNFSSIVSEIPIPEEFNLKTHKYLKCPIGEKCKGCNRFHYEGERRRDLDKIQYLPVLCQRLANCYQQERCGKAHNFMELYYHPQIYRTYPCPFIAKNKQCVMGKFCSFLHLVEEKPPENAKVKCKNCLINEITVARVKCGHTFCKNCGNGPECRKCKVKGEIISIEI